LCDSYNSEILFAEVLLIPEWTQQTFTPEEIRLNGGVPPPPQPVLPLEFTIQLYNPDQQVLVKQKPGSWGTAAYWEFGMPQQTFRKPSASALDRTQSDPAASETTPKVNFKWKKDGKLSKDLVCSLSGKSTNPDGSKKKNKEPDITVALFRHLKEITIYEPNLNRVEMEDPKGLEVVMLLSAVVIKDVFLGHLKDAFKIAEPPRRNSNEASSSGRKKSPPAAVAGLYHGTATPKVGQSHRPSPSNPSQSTIEAFKQGQPPKQDRISRPPPTDPRTQWEIDAETARLRTQVELEEREQKRADNAETKRVKKMLEAEEKDVRRKQAEIDKETARLKKLYAAEQTNQQPKPHLPPRQDIPQRHSVPLVPSPFTRPPYEPQYHHSGFPPAPLPYRPSVPSGPYLQPPNWGVHAASTAFLANASSSSPSDRPKLYGKRSVFGLRSQSHDGAQRIKKKQSSMF